jgi:predicted dinucleotide-binding enzyme
MRIAVIGKGNIGGSLGSKWLVQQNGGNRRVALRIIEG